MLRSVMKDFNIAVPCRIVLISIITTIIITNFRCQLGCLNDYWHNLVTVLLNINNFFNLFSLRCIFLPNFLRGSYENYVSLTLKELNNFTFIVYPAAYQQIHWKSFASYPIPQLSHQTKINCLLKVFFNRIYLEHTFTKENR